MRVTLAIGHEVIERKLIRRRTLRRRLDPRRLPHTSHLRRPRLELLALARMSSAPAGAVEAGSSLTAGLTVPAPDIDRSGFAGALRGRVDQRDAPARADSAVSAAGATKRPLRSRPPRWRRRGHAGVSADPPRARGLRPDIDRITRLAAAIALNAQADIRLLLLVPAAPGLGRDVLAGTTVCTPCSCATRRPQWSANTDGPRSGDAAAETNSVERAPGHASQACSREGCTSTLSDQTNPIAPSDP